MVVNLPSGSSKEKQNLSCPDCDCEFLHQQKVEVFQRESEDSDTGGYTQVVNGLAYTEDDMSDNPSRRRDGIRIFFECEEGCMNALCIAQHKGNEEIYWE